MSRTPPATDGSDQTTSDSRVPPIGVRTHAVIGGRWITVALVAALGLAAAVFFLLPSWLAPPSRTHAPPPASVVSETPAKEARPVDAVETVKQRLLAEEAAARYREKREALQRQGAPAWASESWRAASARGDEAATAVAARDYTRAVSHYDDATRQLTAISEQAETAFRNAVTAGNAAIQARASGDAVKAFQLALMIRPDDKAVQHGLGRAKRLDEVLARLAAGESREKAGAPAEARKEYAAAAALDPEFAPARAAMMRLDGLRAAERFNELMTRGLEQLERSDWAAAEQTFTTALQMRPAHPGATDGLARAKQSQQRETLARLQREARDLESSERWEESLAAYRQAAAIDPAVDFAKEGIARSNRMIALHARIAAYLAEPERLYSPTVRDEALQFLSSLNNEPAAGPRLRQERQRLAAALDRAGIKITVQLASDNATEVTLYRVGRLGRFHNRQVTLTPGTYTLVGSRPGYKDVRLQLIVAPHSNAPQVFIACEERV
jgi:hypothetical protein